MIALLLATALFHLAEKTESGQTLQYPDETSLVDADSNSAIAIRLDREALLSLAGTTGGDPATLRSLKLLADLELALTQGHAALKAQAAKAAGIRASGRTTAAERSQFQAAWARIATTNDQVQAYVDATGQDAEFTTFLESTAQRAHSSSQRLLEWVAAEHARLQRAALASATVASRRSFELAAWIGAPPVQVHIPGYDDLAPGDAHAIDKFHFAFDERFSAEVDAAQKLAKTGGDWNALKAAAADALKARAKATKDAAAQFAAKLRDAVDAATGSAKVGVEVAEIVKAVADAVPRCQLAIDSTTKAVQAADALGLDADPGKVLAALVGGMQNAGGAAHDCLKLLSVALEGAKVVIARGNLKDDALKLVRAVSTTVESALVPLLEIVGATEEAAVAALPSLQTLPVQLDVARDTEVSLLETQRQEGDLLSIRARILGPDGKLVPGGETVRYIRIRSRPVIADTGGVLLWVRGVKKDPGPFQPSAGAYAVLRFTGSRGDNEATSGFWHTVSPGLGVAVVAIPQFDGATHIAWMGTAQLFGDVLQVAAGVTTDGSPVWGFGLGLHRLAGIGKYFP